MNVEQMIAQAEAIIKSQPGYSYNPAKLAEIISAGEIPEDVCPVQHERPKLLPRGRRNCRQARRAGNWPHPARRQRASAGISNVRPPTPPKLPDKHHHASLGWHRIKP